MEYLAGKYDVIVIGAGHAGCEAGLAAARMGCKTLLLTINMDNIALMPCNPAVGGPAKGHLVREIDALGGEMAINTDQTRVQIRLLNTGKGPAVHALRAQSDKKRYQAAMKYTLECQDRLDVKQAIVEKILSRGDRITGVVTRTGAVFEAPNIIVTTGTYLRGRIIIGDVAYSGGPNGQFPAEGLTVSLRELGLSLGRFKTGTPARVDRRTLDFSKMLIQPGDDLPLAFSFLSPREVKPQMPCWLTYTNEKTHQVIRDNLHRSPLYSGIIEGTGPRYCPSIEDKVVRFADKPSHQVFIEPEGWDTEEMYVQGMSTSLPDDVQLAFLRTLPGLENVEIMRPGYAIEYDYVVPTQLNPTLECKSMKGLFTAGQVNGTSGYEEAAAQGLIAGINAALRVKDKEPFILSRADAYIGVLIDDLVTKGTNEPYRMLTSRAEYRLLLRQDNADLRLTEKGYNIGLVTPQRMEYYTNKRDLVAREKARLREIRVNATEEVNEKLLSIGTTPLRQSATLEELLKRPEVEYADVLEIENTARTNTNIPCDGLGEKGNILPDDVVEQVEIQIKYEGYIAKQIAQAERFYKLEEKRIPQDINFADVRGLSAEARQKLSAIRPLSIGQASRISGVSPADISILLVYLEQRKRLAKEGAHGA